MTSQATNAWRANAAPTTRSLIALRLVERSQASARMATIPVTPSSFWFSIPGSPPLPDHPLRSGCGGFVQKFQGFRGRLGDQQLPAPALRQETAAVRMFDELDHAVPEAVDIEQAKRLGVIAERVPAPRLEQFVERPDAAGKREEGVGEVSHARLTLVHVGDGVEPGQRWVRDL